jgi:biopolymer transport protein ExbD
MRLQAAHRTQSVIPTASMADIAFLLIVFFMLTFTSEVDRSQVTLPRTVIRLEVPSQSAYIAVTEGGVIKVSDGTQMSVSVGGVEDVVSFATGVVAGDPSKAFVIKADNSVPYRTVDGVIDALKRAKVEVIYLLSQAKAASIAEGGEVG